MEALAVLVRWVHLCSGTLLVGTFAALTLVARPAFRRGGPEALARLAPLDRDLLRIAGWSVAAALGTALLDLGRQVGVATGLAPGASLTPEHVGAVLLGTRYGTVWLIRQGLLTLLGAFLLVRSEERDTADWLALRLQGALLAGGSLGLLGAAGHAASAQEAPMAAMAVDAVHLGATGVWLGGLVPLLLLLRWSLTEADAPGLQVAADATGRFSALGLGCVALLVLSGSYAAWEQVGSIPALVGTPYGRRLLAKLGLLLLLIAVAAVNLLVLRPRLVRARARESLRAAGDAIRHLRRQVALEGMLGIAILGLVALLGITTPARHAEPTWPFAFRLAWSATKDRPGVQTRVAIGSQIALLGLVAAMLAVIVRMRRSQWVAAGGVVAIALGLWIALPPLAVDAYPTTFLRPAVPYQAASIVHGQRHYRTHCVECHGLAGYGDGPRAPTLSPKPADLTARHTGDHTAGDLFWWVSHGIRGRGMPGFGDRLAADDRWDVINYVRTLGSAELARGLGPVVESDADPRGLVVAPDFAYTRGLGEPRNLKDFRGRGPVVLVLFTLPDSGERLVELARAYQGFRLFGAELLGVPLRASQDVYRELGSRLITFPIVVDGADEAALAYRLFRRDLTATGQLPDPPPPRHMELLVDRQGYLRARWIVEGGGGGLADPSRLLAEIQRLALETPSGPAPEEHVH